MAGHTRTTGTARAVTAASGRIRKVREHLPPGDGAESSDLVRRKRRNGARALVGERIARTSDPLTQVALAADYVKSAAAKYQARTGAAAAAVEALLELGDRIYAAGEPLTPGQKHHRKTVAQAHRAARTRNAQLVAEGAAAVRKRSRGQKFRSA